jgi:hypothetical protein
MDRGRQELRIGRGKQHALNTKKSRVAINVNSISIAIFVVDFCAPGTCIKICVATGDVRYENLKKRTRLAVSKTWTTGLFRAFAARVELATCRFSVRTAGSRWEIRRFIGGATRRPSNGPDLHDGTHGQEQQQMVLWF